MVAGWVHWRMVPSERGEKKPPSLVAAATSSLTTCGRIRRCSESSHTVAAYAGSATAMESSSGFQA